MPNVHLGSKAAMGNLHGQTPARRRWALQSGLSTQSLCAEVLRGGGKSLIAVGATDKIRQLLQRDGFYLSPAGHA